MRKNPTKFQKYNLYDHWKWSKGMESNADMQMLNDWGINQKFVILLWGE